MLLTQWLRVRFLAFLKFFYVAEIIDSALLREWTVQSLIADRTHLVLVSGKLVQQKSGTLLSPSTILFEGPSIGGWSDLKKGYRGREVTRWF